MFNKKMINKKIMLFIVIAILLAILVGNMCYHNCCEGLRVRSNTRRLRSGRRGRRGRRWAGPHRGYVYGPRRHRRFYRNWWPFYPTATIATVPLSYGCKSGCVNLGNGEWGCQFPGDGITQCQFAVDCEACDDRIWWRPSTWFY